MESSLNDLFPRRPQSVYKNDYTDASENTFEVDPSLSSMIDSASSDASTIDSASSDASTIDSASSSELESSSPSTPPSSVDESLTNWVPLPAGDSNDSKKLDLVIKPPQEPKNKTKIAKRAHKIAREIETIMEKGYYPTRIKCVKVRSQNKCRNSKKKMTHNSPGCFKKRSTKRCNYIIPKTE
jgi:hypothetical protein